MGEIWRIGTKSYRDAWTLFQQRGSVLAIALVMIVIASGLSYFLTDRLIHTGIGRELADTLFSIGGIWLAAPYFISLYRYQLRGEIAAPESLRSSDAANRFFAWSAVLAFATGIPSYLFGLFVPFGKVDVQSPAVVMISWITILVLIAVWIFVTRTITLIPAVALDEPTGLRRAFAESRGRFWFIVGAVSLPTLPVVLIAFLLIASTSGIVSLILALIELPLLVTLGLAVTANLYRWLMDHPK